MLYEIYPRSFADSNGDGIGDLAGLIAHLDHLAWLGVDGLWLSPVSPSPNADWGYDVADYCGVDPAYGSLETLDTLVAEAGRRGMQVLLDLVPNHTSEHHPWFVDARSSPHGRAPRLVRMGRPGPDGGRPNNWMAQFGGPAWTLDAGIGPVLPAQLHPRATRPQLVEPGGPPGLRGHHPLLVGPRRGRVPHRRLQHDDQGRRAHGTTRRPPRRTR